MLNKEVLFGFLSLGDEMLFPDYSSYQEVTISKNRSHTLAQDSFIVVAPAYNDGSLGSVASLKVNGTPIIPSTVNSIPYISLFILKGSTISIATSYLVTLRIFPLTHKGGGVELYLSYRLLLWLTFLNKGG